MTYDMGAIRCELAVLLSSIYLAITCYKMQNGATDLKIPRSFASCQFDSGLRHH